MGLQRWRSTQAHGYLILHKEKYVFTFLGLIKKLDFTSLQHEVCIFAWNSKLFNTFLPSVHTNPGSVFGLPKGSNLRMFYRVPSFKILYFDNFKLITISAHSKSFNFPIKFQRFQRFSEHSKTGNAKTQNCLDAPSTRRWKKMELCCLSKNVTRSYTHNLSSGEIKACERSLLSTSN